MDFVYKRCYYLQISVSEFSCLVSASAPSAFAPEAHGRIGFEHAPLRDKVAQAIRSAILSGRFAPGERLVEERLAEEFGVSRNPIREAIRTLASEGLIEVTSRRGAVVASLSPEEASEILEVRAALEGVNARFAARRRDPVILQRLERVLERGSAAIETGNEAELTRLNDEFHDCLALAGHNRMLADLMKTLRDRSAPLFRGATRTFDRNSWAEHADILRAVIAGDAELASLLAHRHVVNAARGLPRMRASGRTEKGLPSARKRDEDPSSAQG